VELVIVFRPSGMASNPAFTDQHPSGISSPTMFDILRRGQRAGLWRAECYDRICGGSGRRSRSRPGRLAETNTGIEHLAGLYSYPHIQGQSSTSVYQYRGLPCLSRKRPRGGGGGVSWSNALPLLPLDWESQAGHRPPIAGGSQNGNNLKVESRQRLRAN